MKKYKSMFSTKDTRPGPRSNDRNNSTDSSEAEDPELQDMRRSLREDQESFILNNLLLCVQFFENYERDIQVIRSRPTSEREDNMNKILSRSERRTLFPGILEERVSSHVVFPMKDNTRYESRGLYKWIEPLQPVQTYVIQDNLHVNKIAAIPNESRSAYPISYELHAEPGSKLGYVRLRLLGEIPAPEKQVLKKSLSQTNLLYPDEGIQESSDTELPEPRLGKPTKQPVQFGTHLQSVQPQQRYGMENRRRSTMSSDQGYTSISSRSNGSSITSKSSQGRIELPDSPSEIPAVCFVKEVQSTKLNKRRMRNANLRQEEEHTYLTSCMFRRYFRKLFGQRLVDQLGFENKNRTDVTRSGAITRCLSMNVDKYPTSIIHHEILPCVSAEWPESCSEWLQRSTKAFLDFSNEDTWLTEERIQKVKELGCHIIPVSYSPTGATNLFGDVEWQINFPAAERYLETCLSRSQAQVYMTTLLLHKAFIVPDDLDFKLTNSHIRHHLFWLIEENYSPSKWAANRCGERLKDLLNKLYHGVARREPHLPDYFIRDKNLFENIPENDLSDIHYLIHPIIDNPILYLITAMKKIRYTPKFYPVMDYRKLYKLLTVDNETDLMGVINPELIAPQSQEEEGRCDKVKRNKNLVFDQAQEIKGDKNPEKKSKDTSHGSVTRIVDRWLKLDGHRLIAVLGMFIEHFTEMAERCYYYGAIDQKDVYLNQAYRLSMILKSRANGKKNAATYLNRINALRQQLSGSAMQEGVPGTSAQSDPPMFSVPWDQFFVNETSRQETRLVGSHTSETNEFEFHSAPAQIYPNDDSEQTTKL